MDTIDLKSFFQKTGKVLFAIAMADKKLQPEEYDALENIITQKWNLTNKGYNLETKDISQIKNVFDWLIKNPKDNEDIIDEFKRFKTENPNLFNEQTKDFIYKTANAIAASYANKNKSELIILGKLHLILKG